MYGITEVFVKHKYYSELRVKLIKKDGNKTVLCQYLGDSVKEVCDYETDKNYIL